jgi:hypothetical protein
VGPTGILEMDGVTCICQLTIATLGGGILDKENYSSISNKVVLGDKFGVVSLFDSSRKLVLDKITLFDPVRSI